MFSRCLHRALSSSASSTPLKLIGDPNYSQFSNRGDRFFDPLVQPFVLAERLRKFDLLKAAQALSPVRKHPITVQVKLSHPPSSSRIISLCATAQETLPVELYKLATNSQDQELLKQAIKSAVVSKLSFAPITTTPASNNNNNNTSTTSELFDLLRPLEQDCQLEFRDFSTPEGQQVFWHSSAHVLGQVLECGFGCQLTHGPPTEQGFFYDAYLGLNHTVDEPMRKLIEEKALQVCRQNQKFERLSISKSQARDLFVDNPFKLHLLDTHVVDDTDMCTVYRMGPFVDLCRGPHIRNTREIRAFKVMSSSQANFLTNLDSLQRVYAVSFPSAKELSDHLVRLESLKENDHRVIGAQQQLFFTHPVSPGSIFFEPSGTRVYNTLMQFIRMEYTHRGYSEVITPNLFHKQLWQQSGHWEHYAEHMFCCHGNGTHEEEELSLKPMNCPAHCMVFAHRERSYRELPLRLADFGVLHRNEVSGSLSGLTRVRKFSQDDAHIFCTREQIKQEVLAALEFMKFVYVDTFGMTYELERSTRPANIESSPVWEDAEFQLGEALDSFVGAGNWKNNEGDGAFYGPKIDVKVLDSSRRIHQCATIQLDFHLPERFQLSYASAMQTKERPVMVHRAMLGSVERFMAIVMEHFKGRWPFWLSPRQCEIVPMVMGHTEENKALIRTYALTLCRDLQQLGYHADMPHSANEDARSVIKEAFKVGTTFCVCVGKKEMEEGKVSVSGKQNVGSQNQVPLQYGSCTREDLFAWFAHMKESRCITPPLHSKEGKPVFEENTFGKKKKV